MNPIQELAKDANVDPKRIEQWANAQCMPVRIPKAIIDRIAAIRAEAIRNGAGSVC